MKIRREDILFLSPSKPILHSVREVFASLGEEYLVYEGVLADAVRIAKSCIEKNGTRIVIATGGTGDMLREAVNAHVLIMRYRGEDMIDALQAADPAHHKVALVGFANFVNTAMRIRSIFPEDIRLEAVNGIEDLHATVDHLLAEGYDTIVGGSFAVQLARARGARGVHIGMEKEIIADTLEEAKRLVLLMKEQDVRLATTNALFDAISEGIIGCDGEGRVTAVNQTGLGFLGLTRHDAEGRILTDLIDAPFLAETLREGSEFTGMLVRMGQMQYSATCVPVNTENGRVVGAMLSLQELSRLHRELSVRRKILASGHVARHQFSDIVGSSAAIAHARERALVYAATDSTVLIYGKSGTGKELFAQSIHNASPRADGPFVAVNCGALPESLLESELFGYVHGAFTGARTGGKTGLFEMAQGGTLFLDEISEMAPSLQARLLRVCQEREITRIGDDKVIPVDVRIIAAANRDLLTLVHAGSFREDLYYRLAVLILELPTLARRMEDLDELAPFIVRQKANELHRSIGALPRESLAELRTISWPGNVRQLSNVLERAIIIAQGRTLTPEVIRDAMGSCRPFLRDEGSGSCACTRGGRVRESACQTPSPQVTSDVSQGTAPGTSPGQKAGTGQSADTVPQASREDRRVDSRDYSLETGQEKPFSQEQALPTLAEAEELLLGRVLAECAGNHAEAARRLGISRTTLWRKLKKKA